MTVRTVADIEAELSTLRAARTARLTGGIITEITHQSGGTKKQVATLEEINQGIALLELELARATGAPSGLGPVRVGFGGRV